MALRAHVPSPAASAPNLRGKRKNRLTMNQRPCPPLLARTAPRQSPPHRRPDRRRTAGQYAGQRPPPPLRDAICVLREEPESKLAIVRRRARLIGWPKALGQAAFGVVQKLIARRSALASPPSKEHGLDPRPIPRRPRDVGSVNSDTCRTALARTRPRRGRGLRHAHHQARHAAARGRALHQLPRRRQSQVPRPERRLLGAQPGDPAHAGVTVHLVDEGVDTGDVLYQAATDFAPDDNIATYQHRQMATALPLLIRAIEDALTGRLAPRRVELPSRQWFHPTLWGYLHTGMLQGVW